MILLIVGNIGRVRLGNLEQSQVLRFERVTSHQMEIEVMVHAMSCFFQGAACNAAGGGEGKQG